MSIAFNFKLKSSTTIVIHITFLPDAENGVGLLVVQKWMKSRILVAIVKVSMTEIGPCHTYVFVSTPGQLPK